MKITLTRSGTVIVAFAGLLAAAPAMAFTHHPSTAAERAQTRDLNLQALQKAQGQAPSNMQANLGTQNTGAPNMGASATANGGGAGMSAPNGNMSNNTSAQQPMSSDESSQPTSPQTPVPDQKPATAPSSGY